MKQLVNYLLFLCIGCSFSFFYDIQLYRLLALLAAIILASLSYLFMRHSYMLYVYVLFGVLAAMQQSFFMLFAATALLCQPAAFFYKRSPVFSSAAVSAANGDSVSLQHHCRILFVCCTASPAMGGQ